jgi:hypothetical protein
MSPLTNITVSVILDLLAEMWLAKLAVKLMEVE